MYTVPLPPEPPKVLVPTFLPFENLGQSAGAAEEFFPCIQHEVKMFFHPMCVSIQNAYWGFQGQCKICLVQTSPLVSTNTCHMLFFHPCFFCIPLAHVSNSKYTLSCACQEIEASGCTVSLLVVWHFALSLMPFG